jgi:hypothetical protein
MKGPDQVNATQFYTTLLRRMKRAVREPDRFTPAQRGAIVKLVSGLCFDTDAELSLLAMEMVTVLEEVNLTESLSAGEQSGRWPRRCRRPLIANWTGRPPEAH